MKKLILTATLIMVAGLAFAQPGHRGMDRPWRHGDQQPREMVQSFRLFKLTETLNLTEDQTVKIFPLIANMNEQREEQQFAMGLCHVGTPVTGLVVSFLHRPHSTPTPDRCRLCLPWGA